MSNALDARGSLNALDPGTRAYVFQLRDENKRYRLRAQTAEAKLEAAEKALAEAAESAGSLVIACELRVAALQAGILDPDASALADLSGIRMDSAGVITGINEAVAALKADKAHLFLKGE